MKFQLGGRKISIQVEEPMPGLTSAEDTMYLLNEIGLAYSRAAYFLEEAGAKGLAKDADHRSWEIFNELKKRGFYDKEDESESA